MGCIECKANNPDGNRFCSQCGAELGRTLEETIRKKGFRDRQATEMEITEAVVSRLMKWARWLVTIVVVIVALFGYLLGKSYMDVRKVVETGKTEIKTAIREGTEDVRVERQAIKGLREEASVLRTEISKLNADVGRYKKVDSEVSKLQKELKEVKGEFVDFGKRTIRAKSFESTASSGPSFISLARFGCPSDTKGASVSLCVKDSPTTVYQLASTGELRPVSSRSPIGFHDVSASPKPKCTAANRGTFYVEKGVGKVADKPFLCAKQTNDTYDWIQLGVIQ